MSAPTAPPSPRQLGELLGLSTGMDAEAVNPVSRDVFAECVKLTDALNNRSAADTLSFFTEFQALYLPAFFRTFFVNSIGDFNAISAVEFTWYTSFVHCLTPPDAPYVSRFVRERLQECLEYRTIALERLVEVAGWLDDEDDHRRPESTELLFILLKSTCNLLHSISFFEEKPPDCADPLRNELRRALPNLWSLKSILDVEEHLRFGVIVGSIEHLVAKTQFQAGKSTQESRRELQAVGVYFLWVSCEAWNIGADKKPECREGHLQRCSRCKVVQYCSPEHQSLRWKVHKTVCFAPTW